MDNLEWQWQREKLERETEERERETRDSCQGTDELIVETGISTIPCQCAPCHDTQRKKTREGRKGDLIGYAGKTHPYTRLYSKKTRFIIYRNLHCINQKLQPRSWNAHETLACLDCSFIYPDNRKYTNKHTLSPQLQCTLSTIKDTSAAQ